MYLQKSFYCRSLLHWQKLPTPPVGLPHTPSRLMLNLLQGSHISPNLSTWAQVYGNYDFNRTPITPPGIKVLVHEKPKNQTTWAPHAIKGWYVGPALQLYWCYCTWITNTQCNKRIADTLTWFPSTIPIPMVSTTDIISSATHDILNLLNNPMLGTPLAIPPCLAHHLQHLTIQTQQHSKLSLKYYTIPPPLNQHHNLWGC